MREIDSSAYIKCLATSLASSISYVEFCNEAVVLRLLRVGLGLGLGVGVGGWDGGESGLGVYWCDVMGTEV